MGNTSSGLKQLLLGHSSKDTITTEESKENQKISCPVCLLQYDTNKLEKLSYECQHTVCRGCMQGVYKNQEKYCPFCRKYNEETKIQKYIPRIVAEDNNVPDLISISTISNSRELTNNKFCFKFIMLGDPLVGKSSLVYRYILRYKFG